jgi:hypothetical protein
MIKRTNNNIAAMIKHTYTQPIIWRRKHTVLKGKPDRIGQFILFYHQAAGRKSPVFPVFVALLARQYYASYMYKKYFCDPHTQA